MIPQMTNLAITLALKYLVCIKMGKKKPSYLLRNPARIKTTVSFSSWIFGNGKKDVIGSDLVTSVFLMKVYFLTHACIIIFSDPSHLGPGGPPGPPAPGLPSVPPGISPYLS